MTLQQQLMEDMKNAMKAKDMVKLNVIRFLRAEIKNYEIDHGEQDDQGVQKIIATQVKQAKDAQAEFAKGGRQDLVDEEAAKIQVLESYLPAQLSDDELDAIVTQVVSESEEQNMGKLISAVMAKVQGQADGARVAAMVKQHLA